MKNDFVKGVSPQYVFSMTLYTNRRIKTMYQHNLAQPRPTLDNAFRMPQAMLSPPNDSLVISKVLAISLC